MVGSGVTGAEFASAYLALGIDGHAGLLARPGAARRGRRRRRGARGRAQASRHEGAVEVADGVGRPATATSSPSRSPTAARSTGSHCILALGSVPNTDGPRPRGGRRPRSTTAASSRVDRVSRTSARGVYAAGDCTGVLMLATVAAMQGRIAMWHFLGDAVPPLDLKKVSSNVFTAPEIATVGWSQEAVDAGEIAGRGGDAAAGRQRPGQDAGRPRRLREAVLPPRHRHRRRRRGRRARAPAS